MKSTAKVPQPLSQPIAHALTLPKKQAKFPKFAVVGGGMVFIKEIYLRRIELENLVYRRHLDTLEGDLALKIAKTLRREIEDVLKQPATTPSKPAKTQTLKEAKPSKPHIVAKAKDIKPPKTATNAKNHASPKKQPRKAVDGHSGQKRKADLNDTGTAHGPILKKSKGKNLPSPKKKVDAMDSVFVDLTELNTTDTSTAPGETIVAENSAHSGDSAGNTAVKNKASGEVPAPKVAESRTANGGSKGGVGESAGQNDTLSDQWRKESETLHERMKRSGMS